MHSYNRRKIVPREPVKVARCTGMCPLRGRPTPFQRIRLNQTLLETRQMLPSWLSWEWRRYSLPFMPCPSANEHLGTQSPTRKVQLCKSSAWTLGTLSNHSSFFPLPGYCWQICMDFSWQTGGPCTRRVVLLLSLYLAEMFCDSHLLVFKTGWSKW